MTTRRSGPGFLAVTTLAIVGGLALLGGALGDWVIARDVREIGGVEVASPQTTPGTALAPQAAAVGLAALLAGVAAALVRAAARRVAGAVLCLLGAWALAAVIAGMLRAGDLDGSLSAAPFIAAAGAAAVAAAGGAAVLRPARPPTLGARYSIEPAQDARDDEWRLAASDDDEPEP